MRSLDDAPPLRNPPTRMVNPWRRCCPTNRWCSRVDDRRVLNGILWRFRTGSPWRKSRSAMVRRHLLQPLRPLAKAGVCGIGFLKPFRGLRWRHRHDRLNLCPRSPARGHGKKGDGDDGGMGRSRGGLTSKIHALVDAEGRPVNLRLTGGQIADCTEADAADGRARRGRYPAG